MYDINKLAILDKADYTVTDAAGNEQPVTITIASPGTKKAAKAQFKRDEARSARVLGAMGGKASKRTEQDEINERAQFLADITESLNGFDYPGGPKALYSNLPLGHIADGVEKFYNDRGNFSPDSVQTASNMSGTQPG